MSRDPEQHDRYILIWSKVIDTQMHFNEMAVKSRQLGLTFVAAALGVAVVLLSRGDDFALLVDLTIFKFQLHISVILILGAWLALTAVKELDLNVYHKMLRGSVAFGEDFEENYMKDIFELNKGMTQAISHFSRFQDAKVEIQSDGLYKYVGNVKITAEDKIRQFYKNAIWFLWLFAASLFFITNLALWTEMYFGPEVTRARTEAINANEPSTEPNGDTLQGKTDATQ